ncbi:DNA mismatch repair protein MutT [Brevibacterium sp. HMSC07C04]|nr:DNA mismatch repair protein MutT [Brevibacterium sp. HMSC07C04]
MVRKKGTSSFMLPGGKIETDESPRATAVREIAEELHLDLDPDRLDLLGSWTTDAANEPDTHVTGTVFLHRGTPDGLNAQDPGFFSEIDEAEWFPIADLPQDTPERAFAPLTRNHVIPELLNRGVN